MHIWRILIIITGVVIVLWFLIPAPLTGTVNIATITGTIIGLLVLIYGIWQPGINGIIVSGWKHTGGRVIEILLLAVCAVIIGLAAACSIAMLKGFSGRPSPGSTVIVLGARVYGNRVSTAMKGRLDAALSFLNENPDSACIVSGGQGKNEVVTEASVMYTYLIEHGIDEERIFMEDRSTDTQENLMYSKEIIDEKNLNESVALATNGYHAYRAENYAADAGLKAETIPAPTVWWLWPTSIVREMYGILEQWLLK